MAAALANADDSSFNSVQGTNDSSFNEILIIGQNCNFCAMLQYIKQCS